ncbi:MAG TPA: sensor histidine kinase [Acidimicrobiales bacterium]|nr:sensor histidine kinase [Acidimicrobiales bacterium]
MARAVATFTLAGLIALLVVAFGTNAASRHAGTDAAIGDARRDASLLARIAIQPALANGLVRADPSAVARLDSEVRRRVLDRDLVRVKVWREDGTIVYSDERRLVGARYTLGEDERAAFRTGAAAADVSDLSRPENRFERPFGKLLEVYQPVRVPDGRPLLFEAYFRYDAVTAGGRRVWSDFAPIMLGALVGLEALQIPLAWSMARRLRVGQERQERLLRRAIEASDAERRRIARDLHDGVVQDLAGVSYSLASIEGVVPASARDVLHEAADGTRRSIRSLRSLLVEIYPPSLRDAGLAAALSDLTAPLTAHGLDASLDLPEDLRFPADAEALIYRVAQEALRNVVAHARARRVELRLSRPDHHAVLDVNDDGTGFDPADRGERTGHGHVGLRVLSELAADAGGSITVSSEPGGGTRVHLEVPIS